MDHSNQDSSALKPTRGGVIRMNSASLGSEIIELGFLTPEQQSALALDYATKRISIACKAEQMNVDTSALRDTLRELTDGAKAAVDSNQSYTASWSHANTIGKTEIIIGNTQQAATGRLSRTMAGERNFVPLYAIISAVGFLILVSMFLRH